MKEKLVVLAFIIMLTGVQYTGRYYGVIVKAQPIVNVVVGITIFAGCFGLFKIYTSIGYKDERKRYFNLFLGFLLVLIAFFALEGWLMEYGKI